MNRGFWDGRRVFVTGHTGFKGSWLTAWLTRLGCEVTGYSLDEHDVRHLDDLRDAMRSAEPEIVIHLAAQALVRLSYEEPLTTFTTNVMGTVNVLEAVRGTASVRVAVMATSDKCYVNRNGATAFREDDPLGGADPYSSSKASAEHAISAYRQSFFRGEGAPRVFSVRAGNVIGGGDWSKDRLVPDLVRAFRAGTPAPIRYPDATRPWQFVLDALHGYLCVAECGWDRGDLPPSFNFGPHATDSRTVRWLADSMVARWGGGASWFRPEAEYRSEAMTLALDTTRARTLLPWRPLVDTETAVAWTVDWYKSEDDLTGVQIERFMEKVPE